MPTFAKIEEPVASTFAPIDVPKATFAPIEIVSEETTPEGFTITGGREVDKEGSILREAGVAVPRGGRFIADVLGAAFGEDKEPMKEAPSLRGFLKESERLIEPRPKTFAQAAVGGIVENLARQASVIGITGGKKSLVLPILASGSGILKYRDLKDQGVATETAATAGAVNAVVEAATEYLPLDYLFKNDITGVKRWVKHTLADIVGENIADFSEQVSDAVVFDKPLPEAEEMIKRAALTTTVAFGSGSIMSYGAVQADKLRAKQTEKIRSEVEAELALAIDKNIPSPTPSLKEKVSIQGISAPPTDIIQEQARINDEIERQATIELTSTDESVQQQAREEQERLQEEALALEKQQVDETAPKRQIAFHGTRHVFDKFNVEQIGTGEGAQAFGHGLYFAEKKDVAEWYRKTLTNRQETAASYKGTDIKKIKEDNIFLGEALLEAYVSVRTNLPSESRLNDAKRNAIEELDIALLNRAVDSEDLQLISRARKEINQITEKDFSPEEGSLFEVRVPNKDELLSWENTLSESKSEKLIDSVLSAYRELGIESEDVLELNAEEIRIDLKNELLARGLSKATTLPEKEKDVSEFLLKHGVRGHTYLDATSRRTKKGTSNFVIYDDASIEIAKRNGIDVNTEQITTENKYEVGTDAKSLEQPSTTPLENNQKQKLDLSEPAKLERALREVLKKPKNKAQGLKGYKKMVEEGGINEKQNVDISKVQSILNFPHTIAKKFRKFNQIYHRANDFLQERDTRVSVMAKMIDPYFTLNKRSQTKVDTIKKMERIDRGNVKFDMETLQQVLTPEELNGYIAFTETMKSSARQLGEHLIEMGAPEQEVAEFLDNLSPETYFPLSRVGKHFTLTKNRAGDTTHLEHHPSKKAAKRKAVELRKQDPTTKVTIGEVKKTADELSDDIPINLLSIIAKFDNNPDAKNDLDKGLGVEVSKLYADLGGAGFPLRLTQAKNTPGFETDLKVPVARYLDSISTWMSRREARRDMNDMLSKIDPTTESTLFGASKKYIDYVTGQTNELAGFRKFLFLYYIGGNVKSAIVNSTQNIMTGWPVLSKYTSWSGAKMAKYAALSARPLSVIRKVDPDLADALQHGIFDGVLDAQHVNVLRGTGRKGVLNQGTEDLLTLMFSGVERYNRKVMFTAAYKEATGKGVKIDGKKTKMNHEDAITFAEQVVDEAHWNLTRADRPAITRGITAPVFTFKLFMANYFSLMKNLYTDREFAALARMLGATLVMGGLSAFPFAKDLEKILESFGYDPRTSLKELAGKYGDLLLHGALFKTGVDISGSVSAVEVVPQDIDQGTWPAVANVVGGVPTDIVNRAQRAVYLYKLGDVYGAVATISPESVRNPLVALRWLKEGMRTPRGEKLADVDIKDVIMKFIALNPAVATKAYERKHALRLLSERARKASENINLKIARAIFKGDIEGLAKLGIEINEHNQRMILNGTMEESIMQDPAAIKRAINLMQNPDIETLKRMPKKARQRALEVMEVHDQPQIGD